MKSPIHPPGTTETPTSDFGTQDNQTLHPFNHSAYMMGKREGDLCQRFGDITELELWTKTVMNWRDKSWPKLGKLTSWQTSHEGIFFLVFFCMWVFPPHDYKLHRFPVMSHRVKASKDASCYQTYHLALKGLQLVAIFVMALKTPAAFFFLPPPPLKFMWQLGKF